jgi:23S rRNA U2552 (ribose-2'-O)-methylase RlmE/FtsJ
MEPWLTIAWYRCTPHDQEYAATFADTSENEVILPGVWSHAFTEQQTILHTHRKHINEYEHSSGTSEWEYYKKIVNPYELVYTQKKYANFPESICLLNPLSRSYFKMIELLSVVDFMGGLSKQATKLVSAHVCEGPGGFIQGFIDACERKRIASTCYAITLKPKQPNVPGWKRATHFLQRHRNIHIQYGSDGTGDLLNYQNQNDFIASCEVKPHLFTGDGGFDFSMDYDSQEQTIFPLLLASVRTGFEVLRQGGLFILKFFDLYYPGTRDLVYFLSQHFVKWTLYKPAISRPCNPELYFVGNCFLTPKPAALAALRAWSAAACRQDPPLRLYANALPDPFSSCLEQMIAQSVKKQIVYLEKVFSLVKTQTPEEIKRMLLEHEQVSYNWCKAFSAPVYPARIRLIEASRTYLQGAGRP